MARGFTTVVVMLSKKEIAERERERESEGERGKTRLLQIKKN